MQKRLRQGLEKLMVRLKDSIKRFPEVLVISTIMVIIAIVMNHFGDTNDELMETLGKVLMTLALGVPSLATLKLVYERFDFGMKKRTIANIIVIVLLIVYYLMLPEDFDSAFIFRYVILNVILYLAFTLIPYFFKRKNYSLYFLTLITKFLVTYLYSLVLYGGINAILFTIDKLFVLDIDSKIYVDILFIIAGIFAITYFLGSIPTHEENMKSKNYPNVFRILFVYIIMPLLAIYTVIIYVYFAKIIITWQWPIGLVGQLVLWYGMISTIVLFFVYTLRDKNKWVGQYFRYFPIAIMIPLAMMYFAIIIRVSDYGITVPRYLVIISGFWILGNMLYFIFAKSVKTSIVVFSALIVLIISAYGPINAYSVSISNQNNRFEALLTDYGVLKGGKIVNVSEELSESQKEDINEYITYFNNSHKLSDIKVIPEGFELKQIKDVFGFEYSYKDYREDGEYIDYYFNKINSILIDVTNFDYYMDIEIIMDSDMFVKNENTKVEYLENSKELILTYDDNIIYTKNIEDLANEYHNMHQGVQPEKIEDIIIKDQNEKIIVEYYILNMFGDKESSKDKIILDSIRFKMLIKLID